MKVMIGIVSLAALWGCSAGADQGAVRAPDTLTQWSWVPAALVDAGELAGIPDDTGVSFSIPEGEPLETHSEAPGGIDSFGRFIPREKSSLIVDGGALVSEVGPLRKTARWGDWDEVWSSGSQDERVGWGYSLTSGEIILPRAVFEDPPADRFVENEFRIKSLGDRFVLIQLEPEKAHRLCFLEAGRAKVPTAGYIGSRAEVNGNVLERKVDGWYSGSIRMSR